MNEDKYVALDVDSANIVAGVCDSKGNAVMESHIRTERKTIEQFFRGLSGRLHVTFEEGTQSGWLYEIIRPLAYEVIVWDPRRNKLLQSGSKNDRIDKTKINEDIKTVAVERAAFGVSRRAEHGGIETPCGMHLSGCQQMQPEQ